jgi:hypothetical protein
LGVVGDGHVVGGFDGHGVGHCAAVAADEVDVAGFLLDLGGDAGEAFFAGYVADDGDYVGWGEFCGFVEFLFAAADDVDFVGAVEGEGFCHHEADAWRLEVSAVISCVLFLFLFLNVL